eukprot:552825-Rhodomonas_salina.1
MKRFYRVLLLALTSNFYAGMACLRSFEPASVLRIQVRPHSHGTNGARQPVAAYRIRRSLVKNEIMLEQPPSCRVLGAEL